MTHPQWFCEQLSNSVAGFVWAVERIPRERWHSLPPRPSWLGQWNLAHHVFHMQCQERYVVQASIKEQLHLPLAISTRPEEEDAWKQEQRSVQELLQQFQTFRHQTIGLISTLPEDEWEQPREEAHWNKPLTIQWTVTKAGQHTLEHTHDVLRLHLFWDAAAYLDAHPEEILGSAEVPNLLVFNPQRQPYIAKDLAQVMTQNDINATVPQLFGNHQGRRSIIITRF